MRRADRLFQIVHLLRTRRFATAAAIAEHLEVSPRTIYRDVAALQASGIPIEGEAGVGYRLARGYELPPLTFTGGEVEALVVGARWARSLGDPELHDAARTALGKIEALLAPALLESLGRVPVYAPGFFFFDPTGGHLGALRRACGEQRKVDLRYRSLDGAVTERTVHPLGLYFWGRSWTLVAWCELRADHRNFRLDRIERLELGEERFESDERTGLQAFLARQEEGCGPRGMARDGLDPAQGPRLFSAPVTGEVRSGPRGTHRAGESGGTSRA